MLASGQSHLVLLDEGCHVLVANHGAFPFLYAHYRVVNLNLEVALDFALATETPVVLDLLACEVAFLRVENLTTTSSYLQLALSARAFTAAS